jgi:hypothetical protein
MKSIAFTTLKAASLLQKGQYRRAIQTLQSSLLSLRSRIHGNEWDGPGAGTDGLVVDGLIEGESRILALHFSHMSADAETSRRRSHGVFDLYSCPLTIDARGGLEGEVVSANEGRRLTAMVLYNMALCFHLRATRNQDCANDQLVLRATKFYQLALDLMDGMAPSSLRNPSTTLMYLATLNNLGHAYQYFHETRKAQVCLDRIAHLLQSRLVAATYEDIQDVTHFTLTAVLYEVVFPTASAA